MSKEITNLEPKKLWGFFYDLTQIPRPSKHEAKAVEYLKKFGEDLGLETIVDEFGNVIIKKPAVEGMENRKGVILQGHIDMVPQKNSSKVHDFTKDPIETYIDGEWVKANETTLGADNGIGVVAAMAVLASNDIVHGPIEALFTVDEEAGMTGAFGIKAGLLDGDILINMDSEDEGELCVGCAGGVDANITFTYNEVPVPEAMIALKISVSGLKGGHSGLDIALGRGNSNIILNRFLRWGERHYGLRLANIDGGSLRNAIPRESSAIVVIPAAKKNDVFECLEKFKSIIKNEIGTVETDFNMLVIECDMPACLIDEDTQKRLFNSIHACPNGVMRMSTDMENLVETSTNLAIVKSENGKIIIQCLLRSAVETAKEDLANKVCSVFELAGAEILIEGGYPGWKPNPNSPILKTMQDVYNKKFGKIPGIIAMHAGLECGILSSNYSHWDMISIGPTIRFPHSPDEKVHIESVKKFYDFLLESLKSIPVK
ncbi:aminoacyl-histidine dipeptidase [Bacteroidota bacterium]